MTAANPWKRWKWCADCGASLGGFPSRPDRCRDIPRSELDAYLKGVPKSTGGHPAMVRLCRRKNPTTRKKT